MERSVSNQLVFLVYHADGLNADIEESAWCFRGSESADDFRLSHLERGQLNLQMPRG